MFSIYFRDYIRLYKYNFISLSANFVVFNISKALPFENSGEKNSKIQKF